MNIANKLTFLRLFLVIVFTIVAYFEQNKEIMIFSIIIFIIASITDFLDGYIARKYNLVTNLGKLIDPLADKILVTSALLILIKINRIDIFSTLVIISREYTISIIRAIAASEGVVIAASNSGKIKTVLQIFSILLLLYNINIAIFIYYLSVFITVISGIEYVLASKKIFQKNID